MEKSTRKQQLLKYAPLLIIVLAGTLLRVLRLDFAPPGLNQDEASAGYEAWAIANFGIDRNGHSFPVLLESWGSGQNALYSYVCVLFMKVFRVDLSVTAIRLPMAIASSISVVTAYLFGLRLREHRFGLLAALVLAVNPWHITAGRWALESNLLPFFVLLALCLLTPPSQARSVKHGNNDSDGGNARQQARSAKRNNGGGNRTTRNWALAGAVLALALYAYGTALLWVPLFAAATLVYSLVRREVTLKQICAVFAVFCLIGFPIVLCNVRNVLGLPEMQLFGVFTLPKLTETRQSATMSLHVFDNLRTLFKLLWTQNDGLLFNAVPKFGLLYGKIGLLFVVLGITAQIRTKESKIVLFALLSGVVTSAFIDANINRVNVLMIPLVMLQARGIAAFWQLFFWARKRRQTQRGVPADFAVVHETATDTPTRKARVVSGAATAVVLTVACVLFCRDYFGAYREELRGWFEPRDNMPYIYILFDEKVPPSDFAGSVRYINPGGKFQWVESFEWKGENGQWNSYRYER
jgi:4-amino-4-deoxy-L-arabinose transferase-like glycosyltransferase